MGAYTEVDVTEAGCQTTESYVRETKRTSNNVGFFLGQSSRYHLYQL